MRRGVIGGLAAALVLWGTAASAQTPPPGKEVVRLAAVRTESDAGLLDTLLREFQAETGYRVQTSTGQDIYELARTGKADIMLTHYRHAGLGAFVSSGRGFWPVPFMSNVTAFLAPPGDPARIAGLKDSVEIFRRIAAAKAKFVVNGDPNSRYLLETLWHAVGRPDKAGWYMELGIEGDASAARAAAEQAYSIWGVTAFVTAQAEHNRPLTMVIPDDVLMQRIMLTVVANPARFPKAKLNLEGARALQAYLLSPAVQARILAFRYAGIDAAVFLPAGRNNENDVVAAVTEGGVATRASPRRR